MNFLTNTANTSNDPNDAVLAATESDVVTGKGRAREAGNPKFRCLVGSNKVLYARCQEKDKWKITKGVIARSMTRKFATRSVRHYVLVSRRPKSRSTRQRTGEYLKKQRNFLQRATSTTLPIS